MTIMNRSQAEDKFRTVFGLSSAWVEFPMKRNLSWWEKPWTILTTLWRFEKDTRTASLDKASTQGVHWRISSPFGGNVLRYCSQPWWGPTCLWVRAWDDYLGGRSFYHIQCHGCVKYVHRVRLCPNEGQFKYAYGFYPHQAPSIPPNPGFIQSPMYGADVYHQEQASQAPPPDIRGFNHPGFIIPTNNNMMTDIIYLRSLWHLRKTWSVPTVGSIKLFSSLLWNLHSKQATSLWNC